VTPTALTAIEPERWVLVFQRESKVWWVRLLACGRYKHVAAYAYLPGFKAWLIYDVNMVRTSIVVVPDGDEALGYLYELTRDADLMAVKREGIAITATPWRIGFWCVPAVAHLIGLRSGALRPDRLWRDCLRAGGQPLDPGPAAVPAAAA
jgi:hypothetical protein